MAGGGGGRLGARGGAKELRPHLDGRTGLSYWVAGSTEKCSIDRELLTFRLRGFDDASQSKMGSL